MSAKSFGAALLAALAMGAAAAPAVRAEPLTPLTPGETQYLEQLRRVFSVNHDPWAFRSDGELLKQGRFACERRDAGFVGAATTFLTPAVTQLAFIYLCPS